MRLKFMGNKDKKAYWSIEVGLYPGLLFGMRSYHEKDFSTHVLYMPLIDLALEIDN